MKNKMLVLTLLAASTTISTQANSAASVNDGYWRDPAGVVARNGSGGCWHTIYWTPAMAIPGCDGVPGTASAANALFRLEGANFATGSAELLSAADAKLGEVVTAAKQNPEMKFEVSGHTDNRGDKAANQKLSEERAAAVKTWLVKHGVAANRISTSGYGETQPIADNQTESGRSANRRVEVRSSSM
jgi:OOP family OmpA-OmpF porin